MTPTDYKAAARSDRLLTINDLLASQLHDIATLEQANIKIAGGGWQPEREARFRAIASVQSLIWHLLAIGLEAKTRKRALPEWLPALLDQIDTVFIADLPAPTLERIDA